MATARPAFALDGRSATGSLMSSGGWRTFVSRACHVAILNAISDRGETTHAHHYGGTIRTRQMNHGVFRAVTVFRDWDGQNRTVVAPGTSRKAAVAALKTDLTARLRVGGVGDSLNARTSLFVR